MRGMKPIVLEESPLELFRRDLKTEVSAIIPKHRFLADIGTVTCEARSMVLCRNSDIEI